MVISNFCSFLRSPKLEQIRSAWNVNFLEVELHRAAAEAILVAQRILAPLGRHLSWWPTRNTWKGPKRRFPQFFLIQVREPKKKWTIMNLNLVRFYFSIFLVGDAKRCIQNLKQKVMINAVDVAIWTWPFNTRDNGALWMLLGISLTNKQQKWRQFASR